MSEQEKCPYCGSPKDSDDPVGYECDTYVDDGFTGQLDQSDTCQIRQLEQQLAASRRWLDAVEIVEPCRVAFIRDDGTIGAMDCDQDDIDMLFGPGSRIYHGWRFFRMPTDERKEQSNAQTIT